MSEQETTNLSDIDEIVRNRLWRRNLPLLVGMFGTYLLYVPGIRRAAAEGVIEPAGSWPFLRYGIILLVLGLFLAARFYRVSVVSVPEKQWTKWLFILSDLLIWLVSGIGVGLLLLAAINIVFWAF